MANYDDIIEAAGKQYNVDPKLLKGIIATESAGNPNAKSSAGAMGLMQIMPSNYKSLGITDPTDPKQNIMGGAKLMSQLLDRFGDVTTALRHYNGGDNAANWGPQNQAYAGKVLSAAGVGSPQKPQTLPGVPTSAPSANQISDADIDAAFPGAAKASTAAQPAGGMNDSQIDALFPSSSGKAATPPSPAQAVQAAPAPSTQAVPQNAQPNMAEAFQRGIAHGIMQPIYGIGQGIAKLAQFAGNPTGAPEQSLGPVGRAVSGAGDWLNNQINQQMTLGNQQYDAAAKAHPIASFAGAAAPSLAIAPFLPEVSGPTIAGLAARGAISGAVSGALNPVSPDSQNYLGAKLGQAGIGAVTGGALGAGVGSLGRVLAPAVAPEAQALASQGVTPTVGQILGGVAKNIESKATSVPILGNMIESAQGRAAADFNRAAFNRALAPIGEKLEGNIGQDAINEARSKISQAYNDTLSKMTLSPDKQMGQALSDIQKSAASLPDSQRNTLNNIINSQIFGKIGQNGVIDGQAIQGAQSEIRRAASGYSADPSFDNRQLGAALSKVSAAIDDNLSRTNSPELVEALQNANKAYAQYATLRRAASTIGASNNGGVFTAAQLNNAVRAADKSAGRGAFAGGNALMQDLSSAGQSVLGNTVPDSGTAGRLGLLGLLAPGAIGGAVAAPGATAAALGGGALAAAPYTRIGQSVAANMLMNRPDAVRGLGNLIINKSGQLIPAGLGAMMFATSKP